MKTAAAAGLDFASPGSRRFCRRAAQVGFVYPWRDRRLWLDVVHNKGRKALDAALKGQVVTSYLENVKEDASAVPVMKDLAQQ